MSENGFDAIVVGAGLAGLACAAELVLHEKRPLLIAETDEVASTVRSKWVGKNRGVMQTLGIGPGRWWYTQARQLNIPLKLYPAGSVAMQTRGGGAPVIQPFCPTAAGFADAIDESFGFPSAGSRKGFEKVMQAGLLISWDELVQMDRVPLAEWGAEQGADEASLLLLAGLAGTPACMSPAESTQHISVFGAFANFRVLFGAEGHVVMCYPDIREGLAIPMAKAIERLGGEVWRGRKVQRVLLEQDRAVGAVFEDGTEVRAPKVAIACGNSRIPKILDPLPPEAQEAIDYSSQFSNEEFSVFAVLRKPVVPPELDRSWLGYFSEAGDLIQWSWPLEKMAPWTTEIGKQLVISQRLLPSMKAVEEAGGEEAVFAGLRAVSEELYPGYEDAVEDYGTMRHKHLWMVPLSVGPKLPRRSESIDGLWFVGDGSRPIGDLYTEGAVSAGIFGGRAMAQTSV